jgi:D-glutamate N-acetyltransferase
VNEPRRLIILTEGQFRVHNAKTAMGVIRYGTEPVVALLDSTIAGRNVGEWLAGHDIPAVATLAEALALPDPPDTLLIGIAPTGGKLPDEWRSVILEAIEAGLDVHSGLHTFLGDDPEFSAAAAANGVRLVDYRRPPERHETAVGRRHLPGKRVILTVGTDCAIGKMSVSLELRRAALAAGDAAVFVPTGQTGMMIDGWGVAVDRVISDFVQGTVEWLVEEAEARGDWILVEGQGSLDHPAYSSVTLGLIHGATPQAMVMVHKPGLTDHDFDHLPDVSFPIARLPEFIRLHETVAGLVAPSRVVAIAVNTSLFPDEREARQVIEAIREETGLPAADPVRFGAADLWQAIRRAVEALPWVGPGTGVREPAPRTADLGEPLTRA